MIAIRHARMEDEGWLKTHDRHVSSDILADKIRRQEIIIATDDGEKVACLRFGYFWDGIPFINLVMVIEEKRHQGIGRDIIGFFEDDMKKRGHETVLTSSLATEQAQHVYRKLGYVDCGCLLLEDEGLEIIFKKTLLKPMSRLT